MYSASITIYGKWYARRSTGPWEFISLSVDRACYRCRKSLFRMAYSLTHARKQPWSDDSIRNRHMLRYGSCTYSVTKLTFLTEMMDEYDTVLLSLWKGMQFEKCLNCALLQARSVFDNSTMHPCLFLSEWPPSRVDDGLLCLLTRCYDWHDFTYSFLTTSRKLPALGFVASQLCDFISMPVRCNEITAMLTEPLLDQ